jgi:hypothetical protein
MSRTALSTKFALAAITLVAVSANSTLACGGGGGYGGGRSSSRFGISYNRNIGHMATQAPRHGYTTSGGNYHHTAPSYHSAPVVHQPVHVQPQYVQQLVQQPLPQQVVQQQVVQQPVVQQDASLPQFAPQQVAQPIDTVATPASIDPAAQSAQSAEDAALAALAAFGE